MIFRKIYKKNYWWFAEAFSSPPYKEKIWNLDRMFLKATEHSIYKMFAKIFQPLVVQFFGPLKGARSGILANILYIVCSLDPKEHPGQMSIFSLPYARKRFHNVWTNVVFQFSNFKTRIFAFFFQTKMVQRILHPEALK